MTDRWLGIDIGGANIKLAGDDGRSLSISFPLWKTPNELPALLSEALGTWPSFERLAVTMTGELADCFRSKEDGVGHICDAVMASATNKRPVFYQTTGAFVSFDLAKRNWQATAAANWHGMAQWVGQHVETGLLLDIGSTTTDLIRIGNGSVQAKGKTDLERLRARELIYTGVVRSPVCAIVQETRLGSDVVPLAQEVFATMLDVYVVLGLLPERVDNCDTADGWPTTKANAQRRLARLMCAEMGEVSSAEILELARTAMAAQQAVLESAVAFALTTMPPKPTMILLGEGHWLARTIVSAMKDVGSIIGIKQLFPDAVGPHGENELSRCSPAWAIACLAAQMEIDDAPHN